jgi:hypothetical protein
MVSKNGRQRAELLDSARELSSSPAERRSILHSYIEPNEDDREEGRKIPTAAHHAIAELVRNGYVRVIITTNFDRLMENALREAGVEPTIVSSVDALSGAEPLTHSTCYLLKLHGDYKDARILNTDEELNGYPKQYDALLDRIFDEHGLLLAGWSGEWDHALRAAMLRAPNRRYSTFWATRGSPGSGAQELIAHRKARQITIADADGFFRNLAQRITILAQTRKQNPLSIDLLVSSIKRYLAKPEYRIQLDEVVAHEVERFFEQMGTADLPPHGTWSVGEFRRRVNQYEAASEPLTKAVGVMGRWGDDTEFSIVVEIIRALNVHAEKEGSGLVIWLGLRSYPAVLIFTAYGLGLVLARRWSTLHSLFTAQVSREDRSPKRIVNTLFLWDWKGNDEAPWKNIEGFERHRTPLSDHLLNVFTKWSKSFAGMSSDFSYSFECFEALGALAQLEENDEQSLQQSLSSHDGKVRMSIGRIGWREVSRSGCGPAPQGLPQRYPFPVAHESLRNR